MRFGSLFIILIVCNLICPAQGEPNALDGLIATPAGQIEIRAKVNAVCTPPTDWQKCAPLLLKIGDVQPDDSSAGAISRFQVELLQPYLDTLRKNIPGQLWLSQFENNLGLAYQRLQLLDKAISLFESALLIAVQMYGPESVDAAALLRNLGLASTDAGDAPEALKHLEKALAIRRTKLGQNNKDALESLLDLGLALDRLGQLDRAEAAFAETVQRWRSLGESADLARALNTYGSHFIGEGQLEKAEPPLSESLTMRRKFLPPDSPQLTTSLNNLASLYMNLGQYAKAEPLFDEALKIRQRTYGRSHPSTATVLNNMGGLYVRQNLYAKAEPFHREALEIRRKTLGDKHPITLTSIQNLATVNLNLKNLEVAGPLFEESHTSFLKLPAGHPDRLRSTANIAAFQISLGKYENALGTYLEAMKTITQPTRNTAAAMSVRLGTAQAYAANGRFAEASAVYQEALAIRTESIKTILPTLGERAQKEFLDTFSADRDALITHAIRSNVDGLTKSLGADANRLFKGLRLNAKQELLSRLQREGGPQAAALLENSQLLTRRLAALESRGVRGDAVARLRSELETIERKLVAISGYRELQQAVSEKDVQRTLPDDGALIDLAYFRLRDPKITPWKDGPWHYAAIVYTRDSVEPVDLGPAAAIHANTDRILAAEDRLWQNGTLVANAKIAADSNMVRAVSQTLYAQLLGPIRKHMGEAAFQRIRHWIVSPDGQLGYLPWEMLVDGKRFWIESSLISYVESPRSLVHGNQGSTNPVQASLALLNPQYLPTSVASGKPSQARLAGTNDAVPLYQGNLAKQYSTTFPGAKILQWQNASETALRDWRRPANLLIWTHGQLFRNATDPLDRIRIVLRNGAVAGSQEGIVSARQMMNLDLTGTQLAIVAGCDTGYGSIEAGEGLVGMRRALWIAGSRSQILSLWPVSDRHTVVWLEELFRQLQRPNVSLAQAAANVQRLFISGQAPGLDSAQKHPYFWAPFTLSGDWRK